MIKKTFYNLPEEKRQRIIDAIMKEFSSSTAEKVSINRIIKTANISRGSFYQYFDDKVDLVEVLTKKFIDLSLEGANIALKYSNNDIFYTYEKLFEIISDFAKDSRQKAIKYKDDYSVECLSQILTQVLKNALFNVYVMGKDSNNVKESYMRKLEIIKQGAVIKY